MGLFGFFRRRKRLEYDDGVVIEYTTEPPYFRDATADEIGLPQDCGSCKFCGYADKKRPICQKYGVKYYGVGCLTKTVCNDFEDKLINILREDAKM